MLHSIFEAIVESVTWELGYRLCTGLLRLATFGKVRAAPYGILDSGRPQGSPYIERQPDGVIFLQSDIAAMLEFLVLIALFVVGVLLLQRFVL